MAARVTAGEVRKIVFACEAGMGSSLIGVSLLRSELKALGLEVRVEHSPVRAIPEDAQLVVCHRGLAGLARAQAPWAVVVAFQTFLGDGVHRRLAEALRDGGEIVETP